ncbi:BREX system Lon protease-like protein BrxL [Fusobacterium necrophorum subsp. funduliforme]
MEKNYIIAKNGSVQNTVNEEVVIKMKKLLQDKKEKERLDGILRLIHIDSENLLLGKLLFIMKLVPIVEENVFVYSYGEEGLGKSYLYEKLLEIESESNVTEADLRGSKVSDRPILFQKPLLIMEEIADRLFSEEPISLLKNVMSELNYKENGLEFQEYHGSIVFNFNSYVHFNSLCEIDSSSYDKVLNGKFLDKGFLDRIHLFLFHSKDIIGDIKYLSENSCSITPVELRNFFLSLRNYQIQFSENIQAHLKMYSARQQQNILKVLSGIVKILYFDYIMEDKELSEELLISFLPIVKFYSYLGRRNYESPISTDSFHLISHLCGLEGKLQYFLGSDTRLLCEAKSTGNVTSLAIDNFGRIKNQMNIELSRKYQDKFLTCTYSNSDTSIVQYSLPKKVSMQTEFVKNNYAIEISFKKLKKEKEKRLNDFQEKLFQKLKEFLNEIYNDYCIVKNPILDSILREECSLRDTTMRNIQYVERNCRYSVLTYSVMESCKLWEDIFNFFKEKIRTYWKRKIQVMEIDVFISNLCSFLTTESNIDFSLWDINFLKLLKNTPQIVLDNKVIHEKLLEIIENKIISFCQEQHLSFGTFVPYYIDEISYMPKLVII